MVTSLICAAVLEPPLAFNLITPGNRQCSIHYKTRIPRGKSKSKKQKSMWYPQIDLNPSDPL